jgi:hypothetical protein
MSKKNLNKNEFEYTASRCKKDGSLYGPIHGADSHYGFKRNDFIGIFLPSMTTLCGVALDGDGKWYILTNDHKGEVTCKKCLASLDKDEGNV